MEIIFETLVKISTILVLSFIIGAVALGVEKIINLKNEKKNG